MNETLYSTKQVEDILDISHRKLDHLIRSGVLEKGPGIGFQRTWDEDTIRRLSVAKALHDAAPPIGHQGMSLWPVLANIVLRGSEPKVGWVWVNDESDVYYWGDKISSPHSGLWAYWNGVKQLGT